MDHSDQPDREFEALEERLLRLSGDQPRYQRESGLRRGAPREFSIPLVP